MPNPHDEAAERSFARLSLAGRLAPDNEETQVTPGANAIGAADKRADDGLPTHRAAAKHDRHGARSRARPVQGQRAALHGRHVSVGQHEEARRDRRARHVGSRSLWRARPAGVRHRAGPRGDREDLLRHRDGDARRGRRADPRHRDLRARCDPRANSAEGRLRRLHPGGVHDRAACRHRCRELPHQRRHQGRPRHPQRHQDADQPRRRSRHVRGLHAGSTAGPAAKASAAC